MLDANLRANDSSSNLRKVGVLLGAGILLVPYVFSWFTLRKGHSTKSRIISFSWLGLLILAKLSPVERRHVSNTTQNPSSTPARKEMAANVNGLGIWSVKYYVDDFGDKTKKGYISNFNKIDGQFSNSATTNSRLKVEILLDSSEESAIRLYEYAGNHPVKAYSVTSYSILVKDKNGAKYTLDAVNGSDRLLLSASSSNKLHSILKLGGIVSFVVVESDNRINNYSFSIKNADGYNNAYTSLHKIK